jgi:hypothetical protein
VGLLGPCTATTVIYCASPSDYALNNPRVDDGIYVISISFNSLRIVCTTKNLDAICPKKMPVLPHFKVEAHKVALRDYRKDCETGVYQFN